LGEVLAGGGEFVRERARGYLQEACGCGVVEAVAVQWFHSCCIPNPKRMRGFFIKKKPPFANTEDCYEYCGTALEGREHGLLVLAEPREGELEVGDADVAGVRVALAPLTITGVSVMDDAAGTEQGAVR
jgi:hypothetical protein